ncbi:phage tail assembly protein [Ostreibacterium oceani]|uniref:Phage tail assembly protein n=1 Tax=Ostreibacterium oceani TaxID=2654998 RepID=A0A6N7EZF4_9GAMM|nr:phage tail assembly protein [Ostreibacterium oceani]MPV86905.1 phage tail assembly protein [Ostreibacterium oceani]
MSNNTDNNAGNKPEHATTARLKTITLSQPIARDGNDITQLTLREPRAGDLRGLKLLDVFQLDIDAVAVLLSRIATPSIIASEVNQFSLTDLQRVSEGLVGFLDSSEG